MIAPAFRLCYAGRAVARRMYPEATVSGVSWLLVVLLAALAVGMVLAMMQLTAALVYRPPPRPRGPGALAEVRAGLLGLNTPGRAYHLVPLSEIELRLEWDVVDAAWRERFTRVKVPVAYRA